MRPPAGEGPLMPKTHVHHWQIDSPQGPTSTGRCKCGAEKEFRNSFLGGKVDRQAWNRRPEDAEGYARLGDEEKKALRQAQRERDQLLGQWANPDSNYSMDSNAQRFGKGE